MRDIIIWGATGHSRVLNEALKGSSFRLVAIFDNRELPSPLPPVPIHAGKVGFEAWFASWQESSDRPLCYSVAIAGGNGRARLEISDWLASRGLECVTIIHASAWIAHDATVGRGSHVLAGALVASHARIGQAVIVNTGASIDHDCVIGDGAHIGPGAVLTGEIVVESCSFVGAGAVVLPRLRIGADSVVGAGSVGTQDVPSGVTVAGNPARVFEPRR